MILTAVEIAHPDYVAQTYQVYLLMLALMISQGVLAMSTTRFLGHLN
jgi:hypothetical protein